MLDVADSILAEQAALVEYLTKGPNPGNGCPPSGIEHNRLQLVSRLIAAKRARKIEAILPKTLQYLLRKTRTTDSTDPAKSAEFLSHLAPHPAACALHRETDTLLMHFSRSCVPNSNRRLENARQFHAFLSDFWKLHAPNPPFLRDLAAFEITVAEAKQTLPAETRTPGAWNARALRRLDLRRNTSAKLLHCAYDVRAVLDSLQTIPALECRETHLVIVPVTTLAGVRVFEIDSELYDLLSRLEHWCKLCDLTGSMRMRSAIAELIGVGIIEARQ